MAEHSVLNLPKHIIEQIEKKVAEYKEIKAKEKWYIDNPISLKSLINTYKLHLEIDAIKKYKVEQVINSRNKRIR
jgi:hypothetical protein